MKKDKADLKTGFSNAETVSTEKYLTFLIDSQLYTVPTSQVVEIIRMQPITFMPNLPKYVKGVINLRGKVVPVIDMRLKFSKEEIAYGVRTSIVIVEHGEMTVGLIVDFVKDVRDIALDQINTAPKSKKSVGKGFVCAIAALENDSAMVLDVEKVLTHKHAPSSEGKKAEAAESPDTDQAAAQ